MARRRFHLFKVYLMARRIVQPPQHRTDLQKSDFSLLLLGVACKPLNGYGSAYFLALCRILSPVPAKPAPRHHCSWWNMRSSGSPCCTISTDCSEPSMISRMKGGANICHLIHRFRPFSKKWLPSGHLLLATHRLKTRVTR